MVGAESPRPSRRQSGIGLESIFSLRGRLLCRRHLCCFHGFHQLVPEGLGRPGSLVFREQAFPEGFEEPQYLVRTCKPDCVQDHNLASRLPPMASLFHREATRTPPLTPTVGGVDGWCWWRRLAMDSVRTQSPDRVLTSGLYQDFIRMVSGSIPAACSFSGMNFNF